MIIKLFVSCDTVKNTRWKRARRINDEPDTMDTELSPSTSSTASIQKEPIRELATRWKYRYRSSEASSIVCLAYCVVMMRLLETTVCKAMLALK